MTTFINNLFFKQFSVRLRFKRDTTFHYYHGGKLYGLISRVLNLRPIGKEFILTPCETGRIEYRRGDEYNFGITVLKNDVELISNLFHNLMHIPQSNHPGDLRNDTVELISIREMEPAEYLLQKPDDDIYTLKFLTPLRMERKEEEQQKGKRYFDPQYFDPNQFLKLLYRRLTSLAFLNQISFSPNGIPEIPSAEILEKYFMWIDLPKDKTTLGGIQGTIKMKMKLDENWLKVLSLGQIIHAGKNTSFGFGEYVVNEFAAERNILQPVKSFLEIALRKENLASSFEWVKANCEYVGVDGVTPEAFETDLEGNLAELAEEVRKGSYKCGELLGMVIQKKEQKIRTLAIPTVRDRVLQRAVAQVLGESIDHMVEENSFAWRKGLSREGAEKAIEKAYANGFNFVLETDIQIFFDNVNWELLFKKIDLLYGDDPVRELLKQWVTADVYFEGIKIKRLRGLPPGAEISPLLVNLYLDEFDDALQDNFKLIRYGAGFIILCKSKVEAEQRLTAVKTELEKLILEMKLSKTNRALFDNGFQYPGYLYLKSVKIRKRETTKFLAANEAVMVKDVTIKDSWLTLVDLEKIKQINKFLNRE
ncbi:MAG: reverse transcriptase domain-containing protein [Ignavibacteria bacterium]|nr:reverse transcriptase domain-containing protein [Ignavibacteria bacterium]